MAGTFGKRTTGAGLDPATPHPGVRARPAAPAPRAEPASQSLRFEYRPGVLPSLGVSLFFGGIAVMMAWVAYGNDRGLILYHLIRFGPAGATLFYWGMSLVLGGGFLVALFSLILAVSPAREVVIDDIGITAPRNRFTTALVTVRFAHIVDLKMTTVKNRHFLHIHHPGGKLTLAQTMLGEEFEALVQAVAERCIPKR